MFKKVLIANRGEVAVRIARTCRELGIGSAAVYSTADGQSATAGIADEYVHIGPGPAERSYLSASAIIEAARKTGADAIHPGYGFLSEDPDFAEACDAEGFEFVGPAWQVLEQLGDKAAARRLMAECGVAMLPGSSGVCENEQACVRFAAEIGYPVIVKAVAGGGGRAMAIARTGAQLPGVFRDTVATAQALYGDGRVYVERYLDGARHVEIQVLCDRHGAAVVLGDRDCSIQRRHQKLIEEAPAPNLSASTRSAMGRAALDGVLAAGLVGAATVEFLVDRQSNHYFLEVNPRLQVEHPVTEMVTSVDIVEQQLRLAAGEALALRQEDIRALGAAVECRINAEDVRRDFQPMPGRIEQLCLPGGPFTRVDTHYVTGNTVPPFYDPLIAKVITWGSDRPRTISRMKRALSEVRIEGAGLAHNTDLLRDLLDMPEFESGEPSTQLLSTLLTQPDREVL